MKYLKVLLFGLFLGIGNASSIYGLCPTTNCNTQCGAGGSGCQITQYENGVLCSTTVCSGKRGLIE